MPGIVPLVRGLGARLLPNANSGVLHSALAATALATLTCHEHGKQHAVASHSGPHLQEQPGMHWAADEVTGLLMQSGMHCMSQETSKRPIAHGKPCCHTLPLCNPLHTIGGTADVGAGARVDCGEG